jgi:DNA-binding transcriptional regulator PaaX
MSSKPDYSKKILKILAENKAVSLQDLADKVIHNGSETPKMPLGEEKINSSSKYAITRSLKGLREAGLVENLSSDQQDYARLTQAGKRKATSLKLESDTAVVNPNWDGKWRVILLDLPESRKNERESLRYLLKKAGFVMLKNSAWISPYPFEHLFMNIKKDLGLTTELMIMITDSMDQETEKVLFGLFGK